MNFDRLHAHHAFRAHDGFPAREDDSTDPTVECDAFLLAPHFSVVDDLDAAVERIVDELLTAGPQAVREAKRLIRERPDGEETARIAARLRTGPEGQAGLRAFLERRKPDWR